MNLTGNTIFITGGGSGIGRALAEALHKHGNKVIISGRRKGHLDAVVKANPGIDAIQLDIADPDNIKAVAQKLIREHPDLNVLINNAGIMEPDQAAGIIDEKLLAEAPRGAIVLHCLPAYRGLEISDGVMESSRSLVFAQAENRLHFQKGLLAVLMGGK